MQGLTSAQRQRHFPPHFDLAPASEYDHQEHALAIQRQSTHERSTMVNPFPSPPQYYPVPDTSPSNADVVSYPISAKSDLGSIHFASGSVLLVDSPSFNKVNGNIPAILSRQNFPSTATSSPSWKTLKTLVSTVRSSVKQQLQTVLSDLVGPRLPEGLRESLISAQSFFASGRIFHPSIILGLNR